MKVTITGDIGSGKSTVAKLIAKKMGVPHLSSGDFARVLAKEKGLSLKEYSEKAEQQEDFDHKVDAFVKALGEKSDSFVLDSRLGWHFIPGSYKVYLKVDSKIGAKRIFDQKRSDESEESLQMMLEETKKRRASEEKRYRKYYGVDLSDKKNYDVVIDTSMISAQEVADKILLYLFPV